MVPCSMLVPPTPPNAMVPKPGFGHDAPGQPCMGRHPRPQGEAGGSKDHTTMGRAGVPHIGGGGLQRPVPYGVYEYTMDLCMYIKINYACGLQLLECSGRPPTPETETVVAVMQQSWSHVRNMLKPGGNAPFRMTELNGALEASSFSRRATR